MAKMLIYVICAQSQNTDIVKYHADTANLLTRTHPADTKQRFRWFKVVLESPRLVYTPFLLHFSSVCICLLFDAGQVKCSGVSRAFFPLTCLSCPCTTPREQWEGTEAKQWTNTEHVRICSKDVVYISVACRRIRTVVAGSFPSGQSCWVTGD